MMKKYLVFISIIIFTFGSCDYLDVVPDDIPTLEHAFHDRPRALQYLYTCYSYLPNFGTPYDPGLASDEIWSNPQRSGNFPNRGFDILYFGNSTNDPILNFWDGRQNASSLWQGIRDCNIFLENIDQVIDVNEFEKAQFKAEVKFLKAFYHFFLLQLYGPIPIVKENLPISASPEEVAVYREPVDEVFDYIIELLDEAIPDLPLKIENTVSELGRITMPIALSIKAKVLVTAASPLFNGNTDYAMLIDKRGKQMFNQVYDPVKWDKAVEACKLAIEACHQADHGLYQFTAPINITDSTRLVLQVSQIVTDKWNKEHLWGYLSERGQYYNSRAREQYTIAPLHGDHRIFSGGGTWAPTMSMLELFYTENGVPIGEDITYDYADRYSLTTVPKQAMFFMQPGYVTAKLHLNREPRFYGSIGVDGGWWFGLGRFNDRAQWPIQSKMGQISGKMGIERFSPTSLYLKKLHNYESVYNVTAYVNKNWNWPILRLADLYLLYAEALNEAKTTPPEEIFNYLDPIRERAGLMGVRESWTNFSKLPNKFTTKEGMREIIQNERSIELAFEMHRFWDLRRWKKSQETIGKPVRGWDIFKETPQEFYKVTTLRNINYTLKDVFWPLRQYSLSVNPNLFQNPGW
ncbi:RagB/SusD family nutrient uptake outer membrane protein [Petrimonas sp.]|uniref:RagB/SusD family nutrient uptake outer membrane protein n=1 Tax=Petrimonas sp. TaxID=2023866 RepID=UPI002FC5C2AB